MIKEILEKESIDEADMAILMENIHLLTESDLVRLGLKEKAEKIKK